MRVAPTTNALAPASALSARAFGSAAAAIPSSRRNIAFRIGAGAIALGLLLCNLARAQQQSVAPQVVPATQTLDEVVVTALKRKERLQDVPASISTISSDALDKLNVQDFSQVADSVPGLAYATTGVGNSQYIIRGIGTVGTAQSPTTGCISMKRR